MGIFWLLLGTALIIFGANWLTDGASAVAKKWGMSDMTIGLTVVAFGTSAPELSISIVSAINGNAPMALGNIVGSNIFNILVIVGVVALIRPIKVEPSVMVNQIGLIIISSIALLAIGLGDLLGVEGPVEVNRPEGIILLLFLLIFMRYLLVQAKESTDDITQSSETPAKEMPFWKSALYVLAGLVALIYGGDRFVDGASAIASSLGVSDAVIGLTIVAAGTSLPELAASAVAAIKGNPGIALGNVIGSCILNIFLVLGVTATIVPLPFGGITHIDLYVMMASALLFWLFSWKIGESVIKRGEGVVLIAIYIVYVTWQVIKAAQ